MQRKLRRNLMIAVAFVAVLVGVVLAIAPRRAHHDHRTKASTGQHPHSQTRLAADYLGLSGSQLRLRLRAGQTLSQIAGSTAGRSTGGLIDALLTPRAAQLKAEGLSTGREHTMLARLRARILLSVNSRRARRGDIPTAAAKMGLSEAELRRRLQHGATLAQVADSTKQISADGLIDALIAIKRQRLQVALLAKSITAGQEQAAIASLRVRVTREVNRKLLQGS
jgi:uncharacterized protein YjeT (DUF2065 family)